jgi:hypothetical protein
MIYIHSAVPSLELIRERLPFIFPEGTPNRNYVIREMAAKTVFVMFYASAIEGNDIWIRPSQVASMTDEQTLKLSDEDRTSWLKRSLTAKGNKDIFGRWYASDSREPIRDETLRFGLIQNGCVIERSGIATTSSLPRYALKKDFIHLFDEGLLKEEIDIKISNWQEKHLNPGELARIKILRRGLGTINESHVLVNLPNGETRKMNAGPSSLLSKAVIEEFSKIFLINPALIFLSESANKVLVQDNEIAKSIGLNIQADKNLPDIIMVDLGTKHPILIFVEVVFSDGPINSLKKKAFLEVAVDAGFRQEQVVFISAFNDRSSGAFRKAVSELAWGSFAWFSSEPNQIVIYKDKEQTENKPLFDLL